MKHGNFLQNLTERGLVYQATNSQELEEYLESCCSTLYCGFDPTADSLHIGSLVPLIVLKRFQMAGHNPIALIGGATGLIGDPSFKDNERSLNTGETVALWSSKITEQIKKLLKSDDAEKQITVLDNIQWTKKLTVLEFLRDTGKYFSINQMIAKESVKKRLQRDDLGISFTEFSYMILQAHDFLELYRKYNCKLQIGGSDQWGNITCGTELIRRECKSKAFGLTLPLVTKADGTKFGKTESGTIWLDSTKTSEYAFYQFWLNVADADVYQFLRYFTFLSEQEILDIEDSDKNSSAQPQAQRILAENITCFVHGEEGLNSARNITESLFTGKIEKLSEKDLMQMSLDGLPSTKIMLASLTETPLTKLLVESGVVLSGKQVKDALSTKAVLLNGKPLTKDDNMNLLKIFSPSNALFKRFFLLKLGRKKYHLFELDESNN